MGLIKYMKNAGSTVESAQQSLEFGDSKKKEMCIQSYKTNSEHIVPIQMTNGDRTSVSKDQ